MTDTSNSVSADRPLDSSTEKCADELRDLIFARTGLTPEQLVCPREKSAMTPCVARDGALAVAGAVCVGCERSVASLLEKERAR